MLKPKDEQYLDGIILGDKKIIEEVCKEARSGIIGRVKKRFGYIQKHDLVSLIGHCLIIMYDAGPKYKRTGFKKGFMQCFVGIAGITWTSWKKWDEKTTYLEDIPAIENDFSSSLSHFCENEIDHESRYKYNLLWIAYSKLKHDEQKTLEFLFKGYEVTQKELVEIMNLDEPNDNQLTFDAFRKKKERAIKSLKRIYFQLKAVRNQESI